MAEGPGASLSSATPVRASAPYRSDISVFGEGAMSQVKTKAEAHEGILTHVRQRRGCQDFSQEFRLLGQGPEWECIPRHLYTSGRACCENVVQVEGEV